MHPAPTPAHPNHVSDLASASDEVLLAAHVAGDEAAFEALVGRYQGKIYGLAWRMTGERFDAEEVLQDVCLTIAQKGHTFRGQSQLSSWIYRVTVNAARMKLRKRRRDPKPSEAVTMPTFLDDGRLGQPVQPWFQPSGRSTGPEAEALHHEAVQEIERAMLQLPIDLRTVLVLRDVQGLSGPEAAEVLHLSIPAMKTRLHRARLALRERLADYFDRPATSVPQHEVRSP